ncbi:MAG: NusG domain II-containing protein [Clostridia bacterium]|nr:NusG domain II-containing protein [Clostridia bacterium]
MKTQKGDIKERNNALRSLFKWGDILLLIVVIVAIVLTIVLATGHKAEYAEVYVDGNLKYTLNLAENKSVDILDGRMTIKVENGRVFVEHSDCSEQLCVHSSPIGNSGGIIVCLPNKVVIKTVSKKVDAVT